MPCCWKKRSYDLWYMWQMYVNMIWYTATFLFGHFHTTPFFKMCCFFFPFGELGLKLGGQVKPQSCSQLPPRWCLVSLETAHENLNHVENETPQIGGPLLDENQLSICIHDATPQAAENPKTLGLKFGTKQAARIEPIHLQMKVLHKCVSQTQSILIWRWYHTFYSKCPFLW